MPAKKLTKRQEEILTFVVDYIQRYERPPTIRDIAMKFEFTVKGAYDHLIALERKGWIERDSRHSRGITVKEFPPGMEYLQLRRELSNEDIRAIPLVGRIAAGEPDSAIATTDEKFIIGGDHVSGEELFALKVNGDSMEDAGIYRGDIVIVKRQPTARNRDIVVALIAGVEEEATLKRYFKKGSQIILHPENSIYEDIVIDDPRRVHINGVVVGLYRAIH